MPMVIKEGPVEVKKTVVKGNYKTISREIFHHYSRLAEDPDQWIKDVNDQWAIKGANLFKKGSKIEWNDQLASIVLEFENESAPCNYDINHSGMAFKTFVESHLDRYKLVYVVTYEGQYTGNADEILVDLLKKGKFDKDNFEGNYDAMGVGCACNSEHGMECALIFGKRVLIKPSSIFKDSYQEIQGVKECEAICNHPIFAK